MVATMQKEVGKPAFDVMKYVQLCAMDIVGEAVMDVKLNVQSEHNMEVVSSLDNIYMLIHDRILKYWLHPDFIFENTAKGKLQHEVVNYLRNFIQKNVLRKQEEVSNNNSIKCKSTLETILHTLNDNPEAMSKQGIIDEMITLFAAGEDSISLQFSWTLLLLALHPEIQDKVYNEIQSVLGDNENFGRDDLKKLYYTTMVIKEVSRLFPVAPFIVREVTEDFPIDKVVLPRGTSVFIGVMYVHRDPNHWEYPNKFYPEHFLPEAVAKRHPFAFMPFSAGARGCIGKAFAMLCMKSMLVTILRNFQLQADGTINDIKLKVDIIARSMNGYNLRLVQRINTL
ncbi:cytochrome P450 4C1-like [Chrysoperla carnea]|uniref:cytochrome P450 4C1-like n=1 Tax=Chrysoperla carnea TaxID=189513 RepID=UPI001D082787|nr:cytochrome P450 4C1-like [Chrysoperla carnea]